MRMQLLMRVDTGHSYEGQRNRTAVILTILQAFLTNLNMNSSHLKILFMNNEQSHKNKSTQSFSILFTSVLFWISTAISMVFQLCVKTALNIQIISTTICRVTEKTSMFIDLVLLCACLFTYWQWSWAFQTWLMCLLQTVKKTKIFILYIYIYIWMELEWK